jgi:D-alanyl-D-alanine carboxypeptidase
MSDWRADVVAAAHSFGVPGLAIAIAAPGREETMCWGKDSAGSGQPVSPATRFQAASTGKHVTAMAVIEYARRGRVDLARTIGEYLPDAPPAWHNRSLNSLLRHTSGIPEYLAYVDGEDVPETRAGFMARYADLNPFADEGASWSYSNTNYILLGFLIAELCGAPYAEAVPAMFGPIKGMEVASPEWVKLANAGRYGPHQRDTDSVTRQVIGDGDFAFTVGGALGWLKHLLAENADSPVFAPALLASGKRSPYACGWFVDQINDREIAHHGGHYGGFTAMAYLDRTRNAGVIALCNLAPGNTRAIRALSQMALEGFAPGSTPLALAPLPDQRPDLTATARRQLVRSGDTLDLDSLAPELRITAEKAGPVRGLLNLWEGEPPREFALVEERMEGAGRLRRYRVTHPQRIEHLQVGTDAQDKIYWAWPL